MVLRYSLFGLLLLASCSNNHDYKYKLTNTKTGVKYYCDSLTTKNDTLGFQNTNNTFIPLTTLDELQIIQGLKDTENY